MQCSERVDINWRDAAHKLFCGVPDRIRTCDLRLRKPMFYPAELRVQGFNCNNKTGVYQSEAEVMGETIDHVGLSLFVW